MKHHIYYQLFAKWKTLETKTKKKILIIMGFLSLFAFIVVVLTTVLLFKAGGYIYDRAIQIGDNVSIENPIQILDKKNLISCSDKLNSLIAIEPWINVPLAKTFESIKDSCFSVQNPPNGT